MRIHLQFVVVLLALTILSTPSNAQMKTKYAGAWHCYQKPWLHAEMDVAKISKNGRRFSATFRIFSHNGGSGSEPGAFRIQGAYDTRSHRVQMKPQGWVGGTPSGYRLESMVGTINPRTQALKGTTSNWGCEFEVAPESSREAQVLTRKVDLLEKRDAALRIPAEQRDRPGKVYKAPPGGFEYFDAKMSPKGWERADIEPVDSVSDTLKSSKMKCLMTKHVAWNGQVGSASGRVWANKTYVIDCRGDCSKIRYSLSGTGAIVTHHGQSLPVPVLQLRGGFAEVDFRWRFTRDPEHGSPPRILIHTWTHTLGDAGPGCDLYR